MQLSRKERCLRVLDLLVNTFQETQCFLDFETPFQLLVASLLAARTHDECVNRVTKVLFLKYPDADAMRSANRMELLSIIKEVTYPEPKVEYLLQASGLLCEKYEGNVPREMLSLLSLPGLGRKSANLIMVEAFGMPAFPVDTHVVRVSNRLGITDSKREEDVEKLLCQFFPKEVWKEAYRRFVMLGKSYCRFEHPLCEGCCVKDFCETHSPSQKPQEYFLDL